MMNNKMKMKHYLKQIIILTLFQNISCITNATEDSLFPAITSSHASDDNIISSNLADDIPVPNYKSSAEEITKSSNHLNYQQQKISQRPKVMCFPECDCHIVGQTLSILCIPGQIVRDLYNPHNIPIARDNIHDKQLSSDVHQSNQSTSITNPLGDPGNSEMAHNNKPTGESISTETYTNDKVLLKPETEGDNPYPPSEDGYIDYSLFPSGLKEQRIDNNDKVIANKEETEIQTLDRVTINKIYVRSFTGKSTVLWNFLEVLTTSVIYKVTLMNCMFTFSSDVDANEYEYELFYSSLQNVTNLEIEQGHWLGNQDINTMFFSHFQSVYSLVIAKTDLTSIPGNILNSLDDITDINLSNNVFPLNQTIQTVVLSNVTLLKTLNLSHNGLHVAEIGCSNTFSDLNTLDISNNAIKSLSEGFCSGGLPQLKLLDLSGNLITVLTDIGKFDGIASLEMLYLHDNLISKISAGVFSCSMSSLQRLSLYGNRLHTLDLYILTPLAGLTEMNISHNQIQTVKINFQYQLKNNDSRYNTSFNCENPFYNVDNIDDYNNDDTKPFKEEINAWPHLETIDLSNNNISLITQSHFEKFFKNCKHLFLGHNRINYVPRYGIEQLHRLENIDLSHNDIDWMDVGTFTNPYLKDIDLSHNKLNKIISMTFLYLPNLHRLDLSHNRLNYLYRLAVYKTCKYGQMMQLDLSHNKLTQDAIWKFMSTFDEMKSDNCLLLLHFQNNKMKYFLDDSSRDIFKRYMEENSVDFIHMWTHTYFNMSHNPFHCDCQFYEDLELIQGINHNVAVATQTDNGLFKWQYILCDKPLSLRGINFKDADVILKHTCTDIDKQDVKHGVDCDTFEGVLEEMEGTPCQKYENRRGTIVTAISIALTCVTVAIIAIVCILKKARVVPCFGNRAKWYKVYIQENPNCSSVTIHYHKSDNSLVTSELVYFVQDCCPSYDVILQPSDTISNLILDEDETQTNLFIISVDLMREIRGNREVQSHYETIIEQSQVSIFLIMGTRVDIEALYPTFWSKVKYRPNVYFVSGVDRLPKLQCVLRNTCNSEGNMLY